MKPLSHPIFGGALLGSLSVLLASCDVSGITGNASSFSGRVSVLGKPVSEAKVLLWQSSAKDGAKKIVETKTSKDGAFKLSIPRNKNKVSYLISEGGSIDGQDAGDLKMLSVLDSNSNKSVVINELTSVGSVWPNAQLINENKISGSETALAIGSGHVSHLVNTSTGKYGETLLNGLNLPNSETMVRLNVLSNLLALCSNSNTADGCSQFLNLTNSDNSLNALISIAKEPWAKTSELYKLFTQQYPLNKAEQIREGATLPYLLFEPESFSLSIRLEGGGAMALGKMMFDDNANMWSGANWMPGSQSGVINSIGGGLTRFNASGEALSPSPQGYNGQGLNGVGWGTGVSTNYAWVGTFNNKIGVFDLEDGKPLGPATVDGEIGQLQAVTTAANGDVWIADNTKDHMIRFPDGDYKNGERLTIKGLQAPFGIAVDQQNRVWVTSSYNNKLTIFPGENPEAVKTIDIALGARGVAIDSKGNAWVAQQTDSATLVLPPGVSKAPPRPTTIMQEFMQGLEYAKANPQQTSSGMVALISPDLKIIKSDIAKGDVYIPWGVSIDGNDNVWVANLFGSSLMHICGTNPSNCPDGKTTGDVIHDYQSGVIQMNTDVIVDDAGNIWSANNWYDENAVINKSYSARTSTFAGGQGFVVTYGVAGPVKNPLLGVVRRPE